MASSVLSSIEPRLRRAAPPALSRPWAAVAVVLRERRQQVEVLVVRRAVRQGDRWSGDAALPGGHVESSDVSAEATAVRETREEVGLDLEANGAVCLGRLREQPGPWMRRWTGISVAPVVFSIEGDPRLTLDPREIAEAAWIPLPALQSRAHRSHTLYVARPRRIPIGLPLLLPCWRYSSLVIWGLTRDILADLLSYVPG